MKIKYIIIFILIIVLIIYNLSKKEYFENNPCPSPDCGEEIISENDFKKVINNIEIREYKKENTTFFTYDSFKEWVEINLDKAPTNENELKNTNYYKKIVKLEEDVFNRNLIELKNTNQILKTHNKNLNSERTNLGNIVVKKKKYDYPCDFKELSTYKIININNQEYDCYSYNNNKKIILKYKSLFAVKKFYKNSHRFLFILQYIGDYSEIFGIDNFSENLIPVNNIDLDYRSNKNRKNFDKIDFSKQDFEYNKLRNLFKLNQNRSIYYIPPNKNINSNNKKNTLIIGGNQGYVIYKENKEYYYDDKNENKNKINYFRNIPNSEVDQIIEKYKKINEGIYEIINTKDIQDLRKENEKNYPFYQLYYDPTKKVHIIVFFKINNNLIDAKSIGMEDYVQKDNSNPNNDKYIEFDFDFKSIILNKRGEEYYFNLNNIYNKDNIGGENCPSSSELNYENFYENFDKKIINMIPYLFSEALKPKYFLKRILNDFYLKVLYILYKNFTKIPNIKMNLNRLLRNSNGKETYYKYWMNTIDISLDKLIDLICLNEIISKKNNEKPVFKDIFNKINKNEYVEFDKPLLDGAEIYDQVYKDILEKKMNDRTIKFNADNNIEYETLQDGNIILYYFKKDFTEKTKKEKDITKKYNIDYENNIYYEGELNKQHFTGKIIEGFEDKKCSNLLSSSKNVWFDTDNENSKLSCKDYEEQQFCSNGKISNVEQFPYVKDNDLGKDASEACCVCGGGEKVSVEEYNRRQLLENYIIDRNSNENTPKIGDNSNENTPKIGDNINLDIKSNEDKLLEELINDDDFKEKINNLLKNILMYENENETITIKDNKFTILLEYDEIKSNLLLENKERIKNEFREMYYNYFRKKYEETKDEKYNIQKNNLIVTVEKGSLIVNVEIKKEENPNENNKELQMILDLLDNGGENIIQYEPQGNTGIMAPYTKIN